MRFPAILLALLFAFPCLAQEDRLGDAAASPVAVPSGAFAAFGDDTTVSVEAFRDAVAKSVTEAAEKSATLSRFEKRRIARVMRGGWLQDSRREAIIDSVSQKLYASQAIVVLPNGVQAAVDWDNIFSLIERLIPLIMQLVSLFGG